MTNVLASRGKGDYFRLGHGNDAHVRRPTLVEGLSGKKIVHVAVGALHCLAVTESGQVQHLLFTLSFTKKKFKLYTFYKD